MCARESLGLGVGFTLAAIVGWRLWPCTDMACVYPRWDMAWYGVEGAAVAQAVTRGDAPELLASLSRFDLHGPAFALSSAPALALFGLDYAVAARVVTVGFALAVAMAVWVGTQLDRRSGLLVGGLVAALLASSPLLQQHSTLIMLEVPATLMLLAAVGCYARAVRRETAAAWRLAWLAALGLFMTKFNYAIVWLAPLVFWEASRAAGGPKALVSTFARAPVWRLKWVRLLVAFAALVVTAALLAGRAVDAAGHSRRAFSLATPLYLAYVLALVGATVAQRRAGVPLRAWLAAAPPAVRSGAVWFALPVGLWMLRPAHFRGFVRFLENRASPGDLSVWESLLYYPRAFLGQFSPAPAAGALVALGAAGALLFLWRRDDPRGAVALACLAATTGSLFHPFKEPRFVVPAAVLACLAAAAAAGFLLGKLARSPAWLAATSWAGVALLGVMGWSTARSERLPCSHEWASVTAPLGEVLDAVADEAVVVRRSLLIGYWNDFSPYLVEWGARQRHPTFQLHQTPRPGHRVVRGKALESLPDAAARGGVEAVLVLECARDTAAWRQEWERETAWLDPARQAMSDSALWQEARRLSFPASGYTVRVYRRAGR